MAYLFDLQNSYMLLQNIVSNQVENSYLMIGIENSFS